jgi:hypothetical protein
MEGEEEVVVVFAMATTMAMLTMTAMVTMMTMINYWLLLESNGMIATIVYFLFIFSDNARENLLATKVMGGGRAKVGWFFVMSMVTVTAMATTTIAMINPCLFYQSNGTMAVIIYFLFYIRWKCAREFVGNNGNSRGEGNRGLVYYYEDGDGNGNGNCNCLKGNRVGQGGEMGHGRMGLFLFIDFIVDGG